MDHVHGLYHSHEQEKLAYYHKQQWMIDKQENVESTGIQCIGIASAMLAKPVTQNEPARYTDSSRPLHYNHGNSCIKQG